MENSTLPELSMLGGPLQRLGCRLGIIREATNTVPLGVALGLLAWGVLMVLAHMDGFGAKVYSLAVTGVHVRFLVAVPLLFACETWVFPLMAEFPRYLVSSDLVPESSMSALAADIRRLSRMTNSWLAESVMLLMAFAVPMVEMIANVPSGTGSWTTVLHSAGGKFTWMHGWYLGFCLPLFRFLLFRWIWRLGLWSYFLWRVRQLKLKLIPIHSDGAGGLGYLDFVHQQFAPLAAAISAVLAAKCAEDIFTGTMAFEKLYTLVPTMLVLTAALFVGPLCIFATMLWDCRVNGMTKYMAMASRYVQAFDRRWIADEKASGESQLGAADLQSLADLTNSVNVARGIRLIPASRKLLIVLAAASILPLLPLFLLKFPLAEVAAHVFKVMMGL